MACINPDGTLTPTALSVLTAMQTPARDAEIARLVSLPVYRVRSSLRELFEAGMVAEIDGVNSLTEAGKAKI